MKRSPHTITGSARNLKLYFEYLKENSLDWKIVNLEQRAEFIHWH